MLQPSEVKQEKTLYSRVSTIRYPLLGLRNAMMVMIYKKKNHQKAVVDALLNFLGYFSKI